MKRLKQYSEKIGFLTQNGLVQAFLAGLSVTAYCLNSKFGEQTNILLHNIFYTLNLGILLSLFYFNQSKPGFFVFCSTLGYLLVNVLKNTLGADYTSSPSYQNICVLLAANLLFFSLMPQRRLRSPLNFWLLILIFVQYGLGEHLSRKGISLNFFSNPDAELSGLALLLFLIMLSIMFVKMTLRGSFSDYGTFFATAGVALGLANSSSSSGLTAFFAASSAITLYSLARSLYYETYKDILTGMNSRSSYVIQTKKFPLKYSIGLISIDDYEKLGNSFGIRARNVLVRLIAKQIRDLEKEEPIFRYTDEEFIIVFRNMDKKETFQRLENIRRNIAAASFYYNPRRKPVKLTVSAAVSEKKRSDADSYEVLIRAGKILQKTRAFSHNVTSQA